MKNWKLPRSLLFIAGSLAAALSAYSQTIPDKGVYYRPVRDSFWAELADDTGLQPTPRYDAVQTLNQNFSGIKTNWHATTLDFAINEDDSFVSQYGGGFPYDPVGRPKPQFSVAEEIVVSIAASYGMKVIFTVSPSSYHMQVNAAYGYTPNTHDGTGSYSFLHSVIDPTVYYGSLMTTELSTIGIADHTTRSFIGDTRIAGWLLAPESDFSSAANNSWWGTYWPFFYSVVHYGGAQTAFAGTHALAAPSGQSTSNPLCTGDEVSRLSGAASSISYMKKFFAALPTSERPDVYGYEWYGNSGSPNYTLSCIATDMAYLANLVKTDSFTIPVSSVFAGEGGTNQNTAPGLSQFYESAIAEAASLGHKAITAWLSDGNGNTGAGTTGDVAGQVEYALAYITYPAKVDGARDYPGPSGCDYGVIGCASPGYLNVSWPYPAQGWHWYSPPGQTACGSPVATSPNGWVWYLCTTGQNWNTGYDQLIWYDSTTAGFALGTGFGSH